ncbi:MAG: hypothetical protein IKA96_02255, partial [Alistipes sp.]|nr:hypothetical protein [Alistipes sp.]
MATRKNNNLHTAESLLRYYDENSIYGQNEPIDERADDTDNIKKLVTRSYLNTYDALYNKYSGTKNFNIDMLQNSIKLGEQDAYFALLEQNKNNTMAPQFYDPQYYDYETMMLELYKGSADNTDKTLETRYEDVYNTQTG